jgi:hypothetical protein
MKRLLEWLKLSCNRKEVSFSPLGIVSPRVIEMEHGWIGAMHPRGQVTEVM